MIKATLMKECIYLGTCSQFERASLSPQKETDKHGVQVLAEFYILIHRQQVKRETWDLAESFEISNPPPLTGHTSFLQKELHLLGTKQSNMRAYGSHSHSNCNNPAACMEQTVGSEMKHVPQNYTHPMAISTRCTSLESAPTYGRLSTGRYQALPWALQDSLYSYTIFMSMQILYESRLLNKMALNTHKSTEM